MGSGGTGSFNKCQNHALLKADCLITGTHNPDNMKFRNYLVAVGGIAGYGWDSWKEFAACQNFGNIEVDESVEVDSEELKNSGHNTTVRDNMYYEE